MTSCWTFRSSTPQDIPVLADIWRRSVLQTHHFLDPRDFMVIDDLVQHHYLPTHQVEVAMDEDGVPAGFMGVEKRHIDTLFIAPAYRGMGLGRVFIERLGRDPLSVDVNEQNPQAAGFYHAMGFVQTGRSDVDPDGRPYPILHLSRNA